MDKIYRQNVEVERLMGRYAIWLRNKTVESLLIGNDTQCFTNRPVRSGVHKAE